MALSEQIILVNDRRVRYYEAGEPFRRTLFFLHGGFGDAWLNWADLMESLAEDYHLISADLPGYGQSERLNPMSLESLVTWAWDLLAALGLDDEVVVVGHSFGGLVGRLLAAQHPRVVTRLVLVNGGVIPSVPAPVKTLANIPGVGRVVFRLVSRASCSHSSLAAAVVKEELLTNDFYARVRINSGGLESLMQSLSRSPRPEQRTPSMPVLMLWGEEDGITPVRSGETIQANIPDARLEVISECGHFPHLEAPDVFMWQVRNFLAG